MRVAIFGGSFNPPHVGHALVAGWLGWTGQVDEVWLLPTWRHAFQKPLRPFAARVAACEALARHVGPFVRVDPVEATLPAPSYTVATLDTLAERHPGVQLRLVVGSDVLPQTPSWRDWGRIAERYAPIVVRRDGHPGGDLGPVFPAVSSTDIRARLEAGERPTDLVPEDVLAAWCG